MAAPCVAYSQPFLPRPRAVAFNVPGLPCNAALASRPACRCLAGVTPRAEDDADVLLPSMSPASRAMLRSQAGPHAGAWLTAIPSDPYTSLAPDVMQITLRRKLRLPLPLAPATCGDRGAPGCALRSDALGDHPLTCPRTGLLARRAKVVERAWCRVAREAVGPEGHVVPQQWLAHTTAPGVA